MTNCVNRYILAIIDGYSKWATLIPLKNANAETISRAFLKHWVAIYGPPERIHSDRGLSFLNEKVNEICATLKIRHSTSSPYYPQGNSMVERLLKTTKVFIFCTTRDQTCEWDSILWMVELSLRSCYNETVKMSPFEIIFQRKPTFYADEVSKLELQERERKLLINLSLTAAKYNIKFKLLSCPYKIGEMVYARILPVLYKSIYAAKYDGPYKITRIVGSNLLLEHCVTGKMISRNVKKSKKHKLKKGTMLKSLAHH